MNEMKAEIVSRLALENEMDEKLMGLLYEIIERHVLASAYGKCNTKPTSCEYCVRRIQTADHGSLKWCCMINLNQSSEQSDLFKECPLLSAKPEGGE